MDFNKISGWASIIGIPLAVLLSWVFFELGQEEQEPIFLEDYQARTVIVDKENTAQAPISILDEQSNPVEGNVVSIKFYFWNNGKQPILFENDVLERADSGKKEIIVAVISSEGTPRILKYDCPVKVNQDYTGFEISQTYTNAINIDFNVMRQFEGIACQIIFEGDKNSILEIQGSLLGQAQGISQRSSFETLKWIVLEREIVEFLRYTLFLFGLYCLLFRAVSFILSTSKSKSFRRNNFWKKDDWFRDLAAAALVSIFFGTLILLWESRIIFRENGFVSSDDLAPPAVLLNQNL